MAKKEPTAKEAALQTLRHALQAKRAAWPGEPSAFVDLSEIGIVDYENGERRATIKFQTVIALVEILLRPFGTEPRP